MEHVQLEKLKPLESVTSPDSRSKYLGVTLDQLHAELETYSTHGGVPIEVRQAFENAKNVCLYTWFVYRFHQIAESTAFTALEGALRMRNGLALDDHGGRDHTLKKMLRRASAEGWLSNSGYRDFDWLCLESARQAARLEAMERLKNSDEKEVVAREPTDNELAIARRNVNIPRLMAETAPQLRNHLAHGSSTLHSGSLYTLRLVCDSINQLFEDKK